MNQQEQIAMLRNTLISKGIDPQLIDEALAVTSQPASEAVPVGTLEVGADGEYAFKADRKSIWEMRQPGPSKLYKVYTASPAQEPSADALDAKALLNALNSATAYLRPLGHHGAKLPSTKEVRKVLEQIDAAIRQQEGGE